MDVEKIVLIQPAHAGRIWGKAAGSPYTLMRLASMVPQDVPVEIWDENLSPLNYERLNARTLVGISSMTLTIDGAKAIATRERPWFQSIGSGRAWAHGVESSSTRVQRAGSRSR